MARKLWGIVVLAALIGALAGCGAKEQNSLKAAPGESKPGDKLQGTFAGTVKQSDLPGNAPAKLTGASTAWQLKISPVGGPSNTPTLVLSNKKTGVWESSRVGVQSDTLILHELCRAINGPVDSLYRYKLQNGQLRISRFKNGCKDKLTEAILTSHPWNKQGG